MAKRLSMAVAVGVMVMMVIASNCAAYNHHEGRDQQHQQQCDERRVVTECRNYLVGRENNGREENRPSRSCCQVVENMPSECRCQAIQEALRHADAVDYKMELLIAEMENGDERQSGRQQQQSERERLERQRRRVQRASRLPRVCNPRAQECNIPFQPHPIPTF